MGMQGSYDVIRLGPEYASGIFELIRLGSEPGIYEMTICSCEGYRKYIIPFLERPPFSLHSTFMGIADGRGVLLGFAEWRLIVRALHLNNLFVHPEARGKGIGKSLLRWGIRYAEGYGVREITLDGFVSNAGVLGWYERVGFRPVHTTAWLAGDLPALTQSGNGGGRTFRIGNLDDAQDIHAVYQFSNLEIETSLARYVVGRIGGAYYRVSTPAALRDKELIAGLKEFDPARKLAALVPEEAQMPGWLAKVDTSVRMMMEVGGKT
ncbi:hypothetical protein PAE9249_01888 [Paenibacillus sp. CECT 9249]|uniref:GNAT family N-acetyltransferase n=1 Tax=Paenibacillus sp. CECT 9249 TaxID=2845385 RepID=UPI001E6548E4|nr:GNAT family N-acetyltransferase [Paenibacillus sp. CECT 9249]CAH0119387.1 hypothetical protein PAE9249_01888 [Paenibacillus sp. CECT 9249]